VTDVTNADLAADPRLSADEVEFLAGLERIRAALADGSMVFDPGVPPPTLRDGLEGYLNDLQQMALLPDLTVDLTSAVGEFDVIISECSAMPEVARVDIVSREEAHQRQAEYLVENPELSEIMDSEPSPRLEIWLEDYGEETERMAEMVFERLSLFPGVWGGALRGSTDWEGELEQLESWIAPAE
jgi:hypothetical protein